jgi:hypothetical protein
MTTNDTLAERGGAGERLMGPMGQKLMETLGNLSETDLERIERMLNGGFQNDLLRRGDITDGIRVLRFGAAGNVHYQQALTDLSRIVSKLTIRGELPDERAGTGEQGQQAEQGDKP